MWSRTKSFSSRTSAAALQNNTMRFRISCSIKGHEPSQKEINMSREIVTGKLGSLEYMIMQDGVTRIP